MLARHVYTKKLYAIKLISREDAIKVGLETFRNVISNEVDILQRLNHSNIIKLVEYNLDGDFVYFSDGRKMLAFYIVLEFAEGGDLFECLCTSVGGFTEEVSLFYFH
jgi:serine/threonine protein kinase